MAKHIKRIKDYDGYFICNDGTVYCNLGRGYRNSNKLIYDELYEIKPRYTKKVYARIYARNSNTGKRDDLYIHRLVAMTFIPNPENKVEINHKNFKPYDNKQINLNWSAHKENLDYSNNVGHYKRDKKGRYKTCNV